GYSSSQDIISLMDAQDRILTASTIDNDSSLLLVRNLPDGSLDPSFGIYGKEIYTVTRIYISALMIQEDGKILVAASGCHDSCDIQTLDNYDFSIIRFLQDGLIDTSFGDLGFVKVNLGHNEYSSGIAVQDDGKIIVTGGIYYDGEFSDIILIRLLPDGKPDSTFGASGIVITELSSFYGYSHGDLIALQSDGKIIVVANNHDQFGFQLPSAILRYESNGVLDHSFGSNGVIDSTYTVFNTIDIQYDASILMVGGWCSWGCGAVLTHYTPSGLLDSTFSDQGQYVSNGGIFMGIKTQTDHKILATGYWQYNLLLMRFSSQGFPDTTFGSQGVSLTNINDLSFSGEKIYLQPDGKILVLGTVIVPGAIGSNNKVFIARFYNDINTSVEKEPLERHSNFEVYPNPASGNLNIALTEIDKNVVITISDISGQVVYKNSASQLQTIKVNTNDFPGGLYFVNIQTENSIQTKKVFISK
ncbi:MAG: T9SS type A sorting domain-containing protein, partial [Saprospiraceae bacterium]